METDVKTKYIDITQLPVAEEDHWTSRIGINIDVKNDVLTSEHFQRLMRDLDVAHRERGDVFEGDWTSHAEILNVFGVPKDYFVGVDKSSKDEDVSVVLEYELGIVSPRIRMIGADMSPAQYAHFIALCTPSRNSITGRNYGEV